MARRIGSENAKNGTIRSHAARQLRATAGCFVPHGPASKASSAASPASAVGAWQIVLSAAAIALRSFHEACASEWRITCTRQVCTTASGNTASIASGKPVSPSTTTIGASFMPRALSSFIADR